MAKGYILSAHRSPADSKKRDAYTKLAIPALEDAGGKFLAKAAKVTPKENGINERTILIEFESYQKALAAYESEAYQKALKVLYGGAETEISEFLGSIKIKIWAKFIKEINDNRSNPSCYREHWACQKE